jgi:hypothetical protein
MEMEMEMQPVVVPKKSKCLMELCDCGVDGQVGAGCADKSHMEYKGRKPFKGNGGGVCDCFRCKQCELRSLCSAVTPSKTKLGGVCKCWSCHLRHASMKERRECKGNCFYCRVVLPKAPKLKAVESDSSDSSSDSSSSDSDNEDLQNENKELVRLRNVAKAELEASKAEVQTLKAQKVELEAAVEAEKQRVVVAEGLGLAAAAELTAEREAFDAEKAELQQEVQAEKARADKLQAEMEKAPVDVVNNDEELAAVKGQLVEVQAEKVAWLASKGELEALLAARDALLAERNAQLAERDAQLEELRAVPPMSAAFQSPAAAGGGAAAFRSPASSQSLKRLLFDGLESPEPVKRARVARCLKEISEGHVAAAQAELLSQRPPRKCKGKK